MGGFARIGLGTYRFILAALVLESHATGPLIRTTWPLNPGIWAVAGFFVLSGFVMRRHAETLPPGQFYLDRFLRIYPHFLLFYALAFVAIYGAIGAPAQLASSPDWAAISANLLLIPMAFTEPLYGDAWQWIGSAQFIPQAWSLGIEASYYLLLPLIARAPRLREALFWASLAIFAVSALNILPPSLGYRCLPGTLWMFLLGWRLHDLSATAIRCLGASGLVVMALMFAPSFRQTPTIEVASGALVAAWIIARLANATANRTDTLLGAMSYSLFLCHAIPIWFGALYPIVAAASVGMAYVGARLELLVSDFRRRARARRALTPAPESPLPAFTSS